MCIRDRAYAFEDIEAFRGIIGLRYRLLPYLYSEFMKAALKNEMYARPLLITNSAIGLRQMLPWQIKSTFVIPKYFLISYHFSFLHTHACKIQF